MLGFAIGYKLHLFEENYEDLLQEARKANPLSTFYPRESLLAYQAMVRRKQEQTVVSDVDNESMCCCFVSVVAVFVAVFVAIHHDK